MIARTVPLALLAVVAMCAFAFSAQEKVQQTEAEGKAQLEKFSSTFHDKATWEARAAANRAGILKGADLDPLPNRCPLDPNVHSRRAHDGYSVENVSFQSLPGFYVTANLYKPANYDALDHDIPAILLAQGHFNDPKVKGPASLATGGRFLPEFQYLASTLARAGAVVLVYDMVGYCDSNQTTHDDPNVLTLQLWDSIRALDYVASLPHVDPKRLGMTGASGGGTQTFLLDAVDSRLAAVAPLIMVSAHFFGGCMCETGLPIHHSDAHDTNNADIAAMAAPRPILLVSDGQDWTKNNPTVEVPYIRSVYALYGAENLVESVHIPDEGHDLGPSKRHPAIAFFVKVFHLDAAAIMKDGKVDESATTIEPVANLRVFDEKHPRPQGALQGGAFIARALKDAQAR